MGRQRSHALLVPDGDALARLDLADAGERQTWGTACFHASSSGTASRLATVNSSSKSSPSVSAASKGGLAEGLGFGGAARFAADGDRGRQQFRAHPAGRRGYAAGRPPARR